MVLQPQTMSEGSIVLMLQIRTLEEVKKLLSVCFICMNICCLLTSFP